ncbi:MAG: retropepsin-like domain-containing protein [Treponema sp.]|nr:retropepsin-like domain-containing protein [Treponema sp.]
MHFAVEFSPLPLFQSGFNLLVEISTASIFKNPPLNIPLSTITVMAHFDTGASYTSIDIELAKHLKLLAIGQSESHTASGLQVMPNFAVDISFPAARLSPFYNLRIGSCKLGFDLENNMKSPKSQNMGVLIGRDIMSRWNIVWNGPTSTVIISD